ncbi:hypothetical protein AVEN_103650-1 [Araneus ventricosus]|uniref:Uncharacterized protein n=1 Tax=Araneus ventricosus TaxID=182803 RepID=A0A4Y2VVY8_ARAVE|nr:hypothetical protein AVEN_103650-1 [Araneus ventricosus]
MSIQTLNGPTCTSCMELLTLMAVPLCVHSMNISREARVPQSLRLSVWFQHDGATPPYTKDVHHNLNVTFGQEWICRVVQFIGPLDHRIYYAWTHIYKPYPDRTETGNQSISLATRIIDVVFSSST